MIWLLVVIVLLCAAGVVEEGQMRIVSYCDGCDERLPDDAVTACARCGRLYGVLCCAGEVVTADGCFACTLDD